MAARSWNQFLITVTGPLWQWTLPICCVSVARNKNCCQFDNWHRVLALHTSKIWKNPFYAKTNANLVKSLCNSSTLPLLPLQIKQVRPVLSLWVYIRSWMGKDRWKLFVTQNKEGILLPSLFCDLLATILLHIPNNHT